MSMRTPLGRARGLGSAKEGTGHLWHQILTSIAMVPLTAWFVTSVAGIASADYETTVAWLSSPLVAIIMLLFIFAGFYHLKIGLEIIIGDYVHGKVIKLVTQISVLFAIITLGLACVFAVLKLAFAV